MDFRTPELIVKRCARFDVSIITVASVQMDRSQKSHISFQ